MKIFTFLKWYMFIIIPFLSVLVFRIFRLAQGEVNEEVVAGVMVGIVLDLIYSIILLISESTVIRRNKNIK